MPILTYKQHLSFLSYKCFQVFVTFSIILFISLFTSYGHPQSSAKPFGIYTKSSFSDSMAVINWNEPEGIKRLAQSHYRQDFYQLAHFFVPQGFASFCGIASSTIVLNALRVPKRTAPANPKLVFKIPQVWGGGKRDFHLYTQETFFTKETEKVKSYDLIALKNITAENENNAKAFSPGLSLKELKGMLVAHKASVNLYYASQNEREGVEQFRKNLKRILSEPNAFIIANFYARPLGLNGGGHISPLGAYDQRTDSLLILDVASMKRPWIWVSVRDFYLSMHTKDQDQYRGYLVVSDQKLSSTP